MDRVAEIAASGKMHPASARVGRRIDRAIDGGGVQRLAVGSGPEVPDVEAAALLRADDAGTSRSHEGHACQEVPSLHRVESTPGPPECGPGKPG